MARSLSLSPSLIDAASEYRNRQDRNSHPHGKFDKQGRWYPADSEEQSCCRAIRSPSRAFPYSYLVHCRTVGHIAALYSVSVSDLRRLARQDNAPCREGGDNYYKSVAFVGGKLLSIYDGETEYKIGEQLKEPARKGHGGGYYVYRSAKEAKAAQVPGNSKVKSAPRVILQCRGEGNYCIYDNGKIAFSKLTPLRILPVEQQFALIPIA